MASHISFEVGPHHRTMGGAYKSPYWARNAERAIQPSKFDLIALPFIIKLIYFNNLRELTRIEVLA